MSREAHGRGGRCELRGGVYSKLPSESARRLTGSRIRWWWWGLCSSGSAARPNSARDRTQVAVRVAWTAAPVFAWNRSLIRAIAARAASRVWRVSTAKAARVWGSAVAVRPIAEQAACRRSAIQPTAVAAPSVARPGSSAISVRAAPRARASFAPRRPAAALVRTSTWMRPTAASAAWCAVLASSARPGSV